MKTSSNNPNASTILDHLGRELGTQAEVCAQLGLSAYKLKRHIANAIPVGSDQLILSYKEQSKSRGKIDPTHIKKQMGPKPGTIIKQEVIHESAVLSEYTSGNTCASDISRKLKINHKTVRQVLKNHNLVAKQNQNHSSLSQSQQDNIVYLYQSGKNVIEICRLTSLKRQRVSNVLKKYKVKIKKAWNKTDFTEEEISEIVKKRDIECLTFEQIGEAFYPPLAKHIIHRAYVTATGNEENKRKTVYDRIVVKKEEIIEKYLAGKSATDLEKEYDCVYQTIIKLLLDNGIEIRPASSYISYRPSKTEEEIKLFVESMGLETKKDRTVLSGIKSSEIDILIPSKNIGIEVNGVFWHSELAGKHSTYHLEKTKEAAKHGVQLLHVLDIEWRDKKEIVKSMIKAKLGVSSEKVNARDCEVKEVSHSEASKFLLNTHIQGPAQASIRMGLYFKNELVALMTFGVPRFSDKASWEIIRFSSKLGVHVVGGFTRLLSNFRKKYEGIILSYANRRFSSGNVYSKNSFSFVGESNPNYHYFKASGRGELESRMKYQKHKLKTLFPEHYSDDLTEWQIMQKAGFNRIWDCGNLTYSLN